MTSNPLGEFYTFPDRWQLHAGGRVHISWRCDPGAVSEIGRAGDFDLSGLSRSNLTAVNTYLDRQISDNPQLVVVIVDRLYQAALAPAPSKFNRNCWYNFIAAMTAKVAGHIWQKIPVYNQSPELFDRLITPTLNIQDLLARFNPEHPPNLLVGLHAWTYKFVKYNTYKYLRANGDPCCGFSKRGIVSRFSYKYMQRAMTGNIPTTDVDLYITICKVFKNYLGRVQVNANQLELNHWQEILAELQMMQIDLDLDRLQGSIDRVGTLVRAYSTIPISRSYDDAVLNFSGSTQQSDSTEATVYQPLTPAESFEIKVANLQPDSLSSDVPAPDLIRGELFKIIELFIHDLNPKFQKIVFLRHGKKLKQREIGEYIAREKEVKNWEQLTQSEIDKLIHNHGSAACKQLQKVYLKLLDRIHLEMSHPDAKKPTKNSIAIDAIKQILEQYFAQNISIIDIKTIDTAQVISNE